MSNFRELQEMVGFIKPHKIKHLKEAVFSREGKLLELYEGIASNRFESEISAKKYFYPREKNQSGYFNRLKRNLQNKLADIIFFIDYTESPYDAVHMGYIYCTKRVAVINIWVHFSRPLSGILSLAEKTMRVAKHHGFAEIIFFVSRYCYYYYQRQNRFDKAAYYENEFERNSIILREEARIDIIYNQYLRMTGEKTAKTLTSEEEKILQSGIRQINDIRAKHSSYRLNTMAVVTLTKLYEELKNVDGSLQLLEKVIEDAKRHPSKYPSLYLNVFYGQAVENYTKTKKHARAEDLYHTRKDYLKEGGPNWFPFNALYVILMMHSKQYKAAFEMSQKLINHPKFIRGLSPAFQQRIHLINASVHILVKSGKVEGVLPEEHPFSVKKFIKSVPSFKIDTGGFGFVVNINTFIHWLADKNYDTLIDKRESLITYTSKHLRDEGDYRARYFLKMLIAVVTKDFSRVRVEAYVKERRLLSKLQKKPLATAKQDLWLEIIPFEDLWEIVLELLD
ncbi:MAG TPA: hypothetical protein VJ953_02670 [Saprospiraceae bacterium]|nr:hypothetical protein [Saprospiraceae bacterium]